MTDTANTTATQDLEATVDKEEIEINDLAAAVEDQLQDVQDFEEKIQK